MQLHLCIYIYTQATCIYIRMDIYIYGLYRTYIASVASVHVGIYMDEYTCAYFSTSISCLVCSHTKKYKLHAHLRVEKPRQSSL